MFAAFRHFGGQLVGVEVLVPPADLFDDQPPLLRHALAPCLQKLLEPRQRRECDFDRS